MTSSSDIATVTIAPAALILGPDDYASPQAVTVDLGDAPSATWWRRQVALRGLSGTPSMSMFDSSATGVWIGTCSHKGIGGWEHCRMELTEAQDNRVASSLPGQRGKGRVANLHELDALLYSAAHGSTDGDSRLDSGAAHHLLAEPRNSVLDCVFEHPHKRDDWADQAGSRFAEQAPLGRDTLTGPGR